MANSNLLKEAIADAKAVRETAIANAKIALEEAFTPRLQSILSQKLQQEMEEEVTEEVEDVNEEYGAEDTSDADSSKIDGDNKQPQEKVKSSSKLAQGNPDTDVETAEVGMEPDEAEKAKVSESEEVTEGEEVDEALSLTVSETEEEEEAEVSEDSHEEEDEVEETYHEEEESDEDELDLEAIIRELEEELADETDADMEEELDDEEEAQVADIASDEVESHEDDMHKEEEESEEEEDLDEEIDLNEILREMGYGEEEEESEEEVSEEVSEEVVEETSEIDEVKAELEEAISTIKELKSTINEVNLLNAKLLYTNKLFRSYDLTNEQKMKVVETLDRTGNVREVKLVFSTLAESFKFTGTAKKQKQTAKINESFASKPVASTAPSKEVITESTNVMADRFKKLANIK